MVFENFSNLITVVLIGTAAYIGLIILLRASGNRTLSKMNSFDLVVTVAFGSALSAIIIDRSITLAEGLTAIALLVTLQFILTWLSVRVKAVNSIIKTTPTLLFENGNFLHQNMKKVRVTQEEMFAAMRKHGYGAVEKVAAVVLESDGSLSVITTENAGSFSSLQGINK